MKLRILRDVHNHKKGEVKDIKESEAKALLTQGYAVRIVNKFAKKPSVQPPIKTDKSKVKGSVRGI